MDNFFRELENVLDTLKSSPIEDSLKEKTKAIFNMARINYEDLSQLQTKYTEIVDLYLEASPPFQWNLNQTRVANPREDENFKKDINQYQTLIEYSLFAKDTNYDILKKWGIDYPFGSQGPGLSQSKDTYRTLLENIRDNDASEIEKPYYTYLIENLN